MNIIHSYLPQTQIGGIAAGAGLVLVGAALLAKSRFSGAQQTQSNTFRWSVTVLGISAVCLGVCTIAVAVLLNQPTILDANNPVLKSINDELSQLIVENSPEVGLAKLWQIEEKLGKLFNTKFDEITVSGMLLVQMTLNRIRDLHIQFDPLSLSQMINGITV